MCLDPHRRLLFRLIVPCVVVAGLAGCAVAPPRTDDPYQAFNRKMFAFNRKADKYAIRPVAKAYTKVTNPKTRELVGNFFENLRSPVTIMNDLLQGRPGPALETTGRFAINTTIGILGLFDPATRMKLPDHPTDFGVTLAHWGVPEGPFLVLPLVGPTTVRDVWHLPVDSYFDPLGWYSRDHNFDWHAQYAPSVFYLVTLRASVLDVDSIINSSYDPYAFERDAYRQHRLYMIYYGDPPLAAIEKLQGSGGTSDEDIDKLLQQQQDYEKTHGINESGPASGSSTPAAPAPAGQPAKGHPRTRKPGSGPAIPPSASSSARPAAREQAPEPATGAAPAEAGSSG
jgi:phospholipid-binding lipoprotein MlaA